MDLTRLLAPRSVAVVGATERPGAYGSEALLNLRRVGFPGRVYAVNPGRTRVHGVACHAALADLPEAPDAVVVAIPAAGAPAVVEQVGALGGGGAVVFAAGFGEAQAGVALQDQLVAAARRHELPVCGPNGNGLVALPHRVALWGDMVTAAEAGPVALVSQSGNVAVNALASRRGLRLHTVVSSGNEAVVSAADWVRALAGADGVRAIALYLEAEGDGAAWCDALERCARNGVGVAVLKAGRSGAGAAAAQAHTGAVAGDGRVFRAFVEECGAAWARDPHELLELAKTLAVAGGRRGGPRGVAVMTCSGGDAAVAGDLAADLGVPLPALTPPTAAALRAALPAAATAQNPLDYTALMWDAPADLEPLVGALAADPEVGRVLVLFDEPAGLDGAAGATWGAVRAAVHAAGAHAPVPVLLASTLPELLPDGAAAALLAAGLPAVAGLPAGLRCAAALADPPPDPARIAALAGAARARDRPPLAERDGWLAEHEVKRLLRAAGLPVTDGRIVHGEDGAVAALAEFGGPVALKLSHPGLRHKSERGALVLDVADATAARAGARHLRALPESDEAALLVERMAPPGVELLVGARADAAVPVLALGLGGVWTEALDDVALVPLPAAPARVERALRSLRGAALLVGGRGREAVDVAAAACVASAAGTVLLEHGLELLELNPLVVHPRGATIVDALARGHAARSRLPPRPRDG
jgi:acyl-CoA synthetase (NDP forming)